MTAGIREVSEAIVRGFKEREEACASSACDQVSSSVNEHGVDPRVEEKFDVLPHFREYIAMVRNQRKGGAGEFKADASQGEKVDVFSFEDGKATVNQVNQVRDELSREFGMSEKDITNLLKGFSKSVELLTVEGRGEEVEAVESIGEVSQTTHPGDVDEDSIRAPKSFCKREAVPKLAEEGSVPLPLSSASADVLSLDEEHHEAFGDVSEVFFAGGKSVELSDDSGIVVVDLDKGLVELPRGINGHESLLRDDEKSLDETPQEKRDAFSQEFNDAMRDYKAASEKARAAWDRAIRAVDARMRSVGDKYGFLSPDERGKS